MWRPLLILFQKYAAVFFIFSISVLTKYICFRSIQAAQRQQQNMQLQQQPTSFAVLCLRKEFFNCVDNNIFLDFLCVCYAQLYTFDLGKLFGRLWCSMRYRVALSGCYHFQTRNYIFYIIYLLFGSYCICCVKNGAAEQLTLITNLHFTYIITSKRI